MQKLGSPAADLSEIFRRMLVNIACGNTDDHLRNHGFQLLDDTWRLAPAFDVTPCPDGPGMQAIGVGVMGPEPTLANTLSLNGRFGLSMAEAAEIASQVAAAVAGWRDDYSACGVGEADIRRIGKCMVSLEQPPPHIS